MSMDISRRQRLIRVTQMAHQRLDNILLVKSLNTRSRYEHYLYAVWAARWPTECALKNSDAIHIYPAWTNRAICPALRRDIADVCQTDAPVFPELAVGLMSVAQILGVLYVLEGSALGARVLERQAASIGMTAYFGARHLAHQTSQPGAWAEFMTILANIPLTRSGEEECLVAAVTTFARYEATFACLADC